MKEKNYPDPWEGGSGSLLEVVDMLCSVTQTLADIVRKQAELMEQEKIAEAAFPELTEERQQAEKELDRIEMKLRRL